MALTKDEVSQLYRKRAARYDILSSLYYLLGFRIAAYRRRAVEALELSTGDIVVELGCGTGANFPLLQEAVGPDGRIIGVDLTDPMLEGARQRVERNGWNNVELVRIDAARYGYPLPPDGIVSSFALTLFPEYEQVVEDGAEALNPGGRFVVLDLKRPDNAPEWLVRLAVLLGRPFGVTLDLAVRHPWEAMDRVLDRVEMEELYFGFAYICSGSREAV